MPQALLDKGRLSFYKRGVRTLVIELLATGFGAGKSPKMPGTVGTFCTIPLVFLFVQWGSLVYMGLVLALTLVSILVAQAYEDLKGGHDAKEVVIDEAVGYLITMTWLPMTWQSFLWGFLLFRFLDIVKPFPIGYLDKHVDGGFGVVVDDVAAGVIANLVLQLMYVNTTLLGQQLGTT